MSIHHLERAAHLRMPATKKLVFMAMCDDADKRTGLAMPGIEKVMEWAGCGKSQALGYVAALIEEGYLERVEAGHRGRRAVFRVFAEIPCCIEHDVRNGSGTPDPVDEFSTAVNASGQPDPISVDNSGMGPGIRTHNARKGPERVRKGSGSYRTPSQPPNSPLSSPLFSKLGFGCGENLVVVLELVTGRDLASTTDDDEIEALRKTLDEWQALAGRHIDLEAEAAAWRTANRNQVIRWPLKAWTGWLRTAADRNPPPAPTRPPVGCPACDGGWLHEDDRGHRAPCLICKPHLRSVEAS